MLVALLNCGAVGYSKAQGLIILGEVGDYLGLRVGDSVKEVELQIGKDLVSSVTYRNFA